VKFSEDLTRGRPSFHPSPEAFFPASDMRSTAPQATRLLGSSFRLRLCPSVRQATCMNGPIRFMLLLLSVSFAERRKGGTDVRLKFNQLVAAVGEGFDKKLESVGRDFRRHVVARHTSNTRKGVFLVSARGSSVLKW
jgi:hypothetical protein